MMMLKCENLKKYFPIRRGYLKEKGGVVKAVDGVSLEIAKGETFGVVGESGCGKTTLGKIILGIIRADSGTVSLGTDAKHVIFQDPFNSLNPKMKVFDIIGEGLAIRGEDPGIIRRRVGEILDLVKLPNSSSSKYPHQFSGGERQRIAIGRALATDPEFIVCDEPVSSLDVTIQFQILKLLKDIQKKLSITYLFISHDLRVVKFMCQRVAVMRQGKIVEQGSSEEIYTKPSHPYTQALLSSILDIYPQK